MDDVKEDKKKEYVDLKFRWDAKIKQKAQCDTKHMMYLIKLALDKVYERNIERHEHFDKIGKPERKLDHLDNEQILTNLIKACSVPDADGNYFKIDGQYFSTASRKEFITSIIEKADIKLGWGIKIYAKLDREVHIDTDEFSACVIPNYEYTRIAADGAILQDLDKAEFQDATAKLLEAAKNETKYKKLLDLTEDFKEFIKAGEYDGTKWVDTEKKELTKLMKDYIAKKRNLEEKAAKKLNGAIGKIHSLFKSFDVKLYKENGEVVIKAK